MTHCASLMTHSASLCDHNVGSIEDVGYIEDACSQLNIVYIILYSIYMFVCVCVLYHRRESFDTFKISKCSPEISSMYKKPCPGPSRNMQTIVQFPSILPKVSKHSRFVVKDILCCYTIEQCICLISG